MDHIMTYEEYLRDVKKGIVTDLGNSPVTPLLLMLQGKWKTQILYELCIHDTVSAVLYRCEATDQGYKQEEVAVGDVVCLYVTAPVSAVLYRCEATEVNIPYHYDDGNVHMNHVIRLKKLDQYNPSFLPFEKLKAYGIGAVRGPRRMPHSLICELERNRYE